MKRMLSFVRRAVDDYVMIEDGDRIAVGVSGGTADEDIAFAQFGAMYLERRLSL